MTTASKTQPADTVPPTEPLTLANGRLAALSWGRRDAPTWLALHGWLDNAASFSRLAPRLVEVLDIRIVAIDFRGHGESLGEGAIQHDYALWDYCHDVLDAMEELALSQVTLLAHSMGAAVSCLLAASVPERVTQLLLIDGLGAITTPPEETSEQLRKGLVAHRRPRSNPPRYVDIDSAVAARVAGGVTPIDAETAKPLVARNSRLDDDGHVLLRTDGRLLKPSLVRFTPAQVLSMLGDIRCPVLLIEGDGGILGERAWAKKARQAVPTLTRHVLAGGHHLHLEPAAVTSVAQTIIQHTDTQHSDTQQTVARQDNQEATHG
ncbi:alpha/beta hydrolase [Halomonas vilamensis]|uniref:Alpha/beta hydrolase n=1 Tax=Vreelandella vilamensis TaxID=531309 RepID=A0ABU1H5A8_9GAMM|nr:alpha/beta hydrolase [Halomonas vilamensis]MDR5899491.1 alpha/beta hydrolase [Halomonas vilamensis]